MVARIRTVSFKGIDIFDTDIELQVAKRLAKILRRIFFLLILSASLFIPCSVPAQVVLDDISNLNLTLVSEIRKPLTEQDIQKAVRDAVISGRKISIAGKRHSQGGHIMADNALVLDMTSYNKILGLDAEKKILKVQSGVTWSEIQDYLNDKGFAIKVQQSSNIFTVGGSLSVNIHGRDPRFGPIIETVRSFRLVKPDGSIALVTPQKNKELFSLVIGGYGLFGVITEVDLDITENSILKRTSSIMNCAKYPAYLQDGILGDEKIEINYARPSITRKGFMDECIITTYERIADKPEDLQPLNQEKFIAGSRWILDLSRKSDWGKSSRWFIQESYLDELGAPEVISRNNAMRPPIKFLDYKGQKDTDVLQEYFIPLDRADQFREKLKQIVLKHSINVLSITLRYTKKDDMAFLSYAKKDSLAFVLYLNHKKDEASVKDVKIWTKEIIDAAIENNGTYYLTYSNYASREQFKKAYPEMESFFNRKSLYDPHIVFTNKFYEEYKN